MIKVDTEPNSRLDSYLAEKINLSRSKIQKLIKEKLVTDQNAKDAITHFKVLKQFKETTLIECILETGRTHQIRVHLSYINHPVVNDPAYGKGKTTEFGQMLHSKSIKFIHPRTKKELFFEVEPPKEFLEKLEELRTEE